MSDEWAKVSRSNHCPVCDKPDWCTITTDGKTACCMRIPSDRPAKNGGYFHNVDGSPVQTLKPRKNEKLPPAVIARILKGYSISNTAETIVYHPRSRFYAALSGWRSMDGGHVLPMRDTDGVPVGIRYRYATGEKSSEKGGSDGLFFDPSILLAHCRTLFVCEGATDHLALSLCGFPTLGRSNCRTGRDSINDISEKCQASEIIIVTDNDPVKKRADGTQFQPGIDGARALAQGLRLPCKLLIPPAATKDVRGFVNRLLDSGYEPSDIHVTILKMTKDLERMKK